MAESKPKSRKQGPGNYDKQQMIRMHGIFAGIAPIAKGHFMWSITPCRVGRTTQVMAMRHASLLHFQEFSKGKRLLTDMQFTECEPNRKFGPVLMYDIIPAPPHQYIGWVVVQSDIDEEPIVEFTSHGYFKLPRKPIVGRK